MIPNNVFKELFVELIIHSMSKIIKIIYFVLEKDI